MLLAFAVPSAEERKFDADAHAKAVAPFVEGRTFGVLRVDLTHLDPDALSKSAAPIVGPDQAEHMRAGIAHIAALSKQGASDLYVVFSLADIPTGPFVVLPARGEVAKKLAAAIQEGPGVPADHIAEVDGAVVLGPPETLKRLHALKAEARPEITAAFATAGPGFAQLVLVPTKDLPRIVEETMPNLPPELGGGSTKVLTRGLKSIAVGVTSPPKMQLRVVVQAADANAARELDALRQQALKAAVANAEKHPQLPNLKRLAEIVMPRIEGDRLTLDLDETTLVKALEQPADKVRAAAERARSSNNLKQIAIAMHNYHSVHGTFPPAASIGKGNKQLLSWRVHILPYIEQDALYKEFHLDEPWDSEHNKKLIAKMPEVFRSTKDDKIFKAGKTTYLAPRGKDTMFPPGEKGIRAADVTDGLSNTIMMIDAADEKAVIWTRPDDLEIDADNPAKGLSTRHGMGFLVGMADGSVRMIPAKIDKKVLWAMFTRAGGEVIPEK
jgi:hypothetical protein